MGKRIPRTIIGAPGSEGQYSRRVPRILVGAPGSEGLYSKRRAKPLKALKPKRII